MLSITSNVQRDYLFRRSGEVGYQARLVEGYARAFKSAETELDALMKRVEAGEQGISFSMREARLKSLLRQYTEAINSFTSIAKATARAAGVSGLQEALRYTPNEVARAMGRAPTGVQPADVMDDRTWSKINRNAYEAVSSMFRSTASPLLDSMAKLGAQTMDAVRTELQQGILLGRNPLKIASRIKATTSNMALGRARVIARTEFHRAYRQANREQYAASDVVKGWVWKANLDSGTCPVCIAMGGTEHPTSELLDGHPACRCSMVPLTKTWSELGFGTGEFDHPAALDVPNGEDWFRTLSAEQQHRILGPGRAKLYNNGTPLSSMVQQTHSPLWGSMRTLRPLGTPTGIKSPPLPPALTTTPQVPLRERMKPAGYFDAMESPEALARYLKSEYDIDLTNPSAYARSHREEIVAGLDTYRRIVDLKTMDTLKTIEYREDLGWHPLEPGHKTPAHYDGGVATIRFALESLQNVTYRPFSGSRVGMSWFRGTVIHETAHALEASLSAQLRNEWEAIHAATGGGALVTRSLNSAIQLRAGAVRQRAYYQQLIDSGGATGGESYYRNRIEYQDRLIATYDAKITTLRDMKRQYEATASKDAWPSDYAKNNGNEDFAVSMEWYLNQPDWLARNCPTRYAFLSRLFG